MARNDLPRIVGAEKALQMVTSGEHVPAQQCLAMGLVDELTEENDLKNGGQGAPLAPIFHNLLWLKFAMHKTL